MTPRHAMALEYAAAGVPVFPCLPGAKRPATAHSFYDRSRNPGTIDTWWRQADYNLALVPDDLGCVVIDIDGPQGQDSWMQFIAEHGIAFAPEWRVQTPSGGWHLYFSGSLLAASNVNLTAASAACTRIVASSNGKAIIIFAATFTTSGCQNIGWIASGARGASTNVQTAMPFGTYGGMDANRMPNALWIFPSGSNAIMTTTSACLVAGNLTYTYATS